MEFRNDIKKPEIQIKQVLDVKDIGWCDEAVLICVKNGKGTLTHRVSEEDEAYMFSSQLLLNDKPIMQAKYPICPTCAGMLATGYGVENIDSPELIKVRECMNSEYKGIIDAVENVKPLLGLLNDGYYVLADAKLYPSDGQGGFFYSVSNELTYHEATCSEYYDSDFLSSVEGFPAYIYPTQSSEFIQEERVEEYAEIIKASSNPPRGLAYYEEGFMCALLDGHHKACATSMVGKIFHCLTIIPPNRFLFGDGVRHVDGDTFIKSVSFAGISVEVEQGTKYKEYCPIKGAREKKIHIPVYNLTGRELPNQYRNQYPTIQTLSGIMNAEIDIKGDVVACAKTFILSHDEEQAMKLDYLMKYLRSCRREEAYVIAKMILDEEDDHFIVAAQESAIKEMLKHRNEETEQYMMNYLVNHDYKDPCWYLVNSYWN